MVTPRAARPVCRTGQPAGPLTGGTQAPPFSVYIAVDMHAPLTQAENIPQRAQLGPQRVLSVSLAQMPSAQMWNPATQARTQEVPLHDTDPWSGATQVVHDGPQASAVLFGTQAGACAVPRRQVPALQVNPQVVPLQVAVALAGTWHGVHELPQLFGLLLDTHMLLQAWFPAVHVTGQGVPSATQSAPQKRKPTLHAGTHAPAALHVTLPLSGALQGAQLFPQEATVVPLLTTHVASAPVPQR
ncbi:MAG: hypothetical protein ABUL77_02980 [Bacteroidota bacterium]